MSNQIEWPVECAFKKLTQNGAELYTDSYKAICMKTFYSNEFIKLVSTFIRLSESQVSAYVSDKKYQSKLINSITKNKLHTAVILNDYQRVTKYIKKYNYIVTSDVVKLACLNSHDDILILSMIDEITPSLLNNLESIAIMCDVKNILGYKYLIKKIKPTINIYNRAVMHMPIDIIEEIDTAIAPTSTTLKNAVMYGDPNIVMHVLRSYLNLSKPFDKNLVAYMIMNEHTDALDYLHENGLVDWHTDLYYSGILSGSIQILDYLDKYYPNIHKNKILDTPHGKTIGKKTDLTTDMIYKFDGKKYFSNTMNYAIQSNSVNMVRHISSLSYGISIANIITATRSNIDIFAYVIEKYQKKIPSYILVYFSLNNVISNKYEKLSILISSNKIDIFEKPMYKLESIHTEIIRSNKNIDLIHMYSADYLFNYANSLSNYPGIKFNHRVYVITSYVVLANKLDLLNNLLIHYKNKYDRQLIHDVIFCHTTTHSDLNKFINRYKELTSDTEFIISNSLWSLLIPSRSIEKIIIAISNKNIISDQIYTTAYLFADKQILHILSKYAVEINPDIIIGLLDKNFIYDHIDSIPLTKNNILRLLSIDSKKITSKIVNSGYSDDIIEYLHKYCIDKQYMISYYYLTNLQK